MKIKITKVIDNNKIELEEECDISCFTEVRRMMVKEALYAIKDLTASKKDKEENKEEHEEETLPMASDKQKAYMDKLGIAYDKKITKIDAIRLINDYKRANGIPVTSQNQNL